MNKMRLTLVAVFALCFSFCFYSASARAQTDSAPDLSPVRGGSPPPAATDSAGAAVPGTQPPAFVPAPISPRTGPKAANLADDTAGDTGSQAGADVNKPVEPAPPEVRAEALPEVVPPVEPQVEPVPARAPVARTAPRYGLSKLGAAVMLGGGFQQFTAGSLQDVTSAGGFWNARVVAGTRQFVGLEAAYVGAAHNMNALGFGTRAALVSNGVEGAMRINIPIIQGRSLFEPFGFVGLGWSRYNVVNTETRSSDVASLDDIMTVPYGGGLEMAYGAFIADARFTYRSTYFNDLMRTSGGRLDSWGVGGQMGVTF